MQNVNVAVVGCGYWGSKHVRALRSTPGVGRVFAVDEQLARVNSVRAALPGVEGATSLAEVLDVVDAVVVATPPSAHLAPSLQAIAAGKHVLVEKPLAPSVAEARTLVEAAADKGVVLMVGHTYEYHPAVWALRDLARSGELGDIHYLDAARLNLGLYQRDVNVVWDLAPHDISICNLIVGSRPVRVEAWGSSHAHPSLEDVAHLRLHYTNPDIVAHLHLSWLDPLKVRKVTVVGSQKMAVFDDMSNEERLRVYDKGIVEPRDEDGNVDNSQAPGSYRYGDITIPFIASQEPLSVEDSHFITCIREGKVPVSDGLSGLAVVEVLAAAQLSLDLGRPVDLSELDDLEVDLRAGSEPSPVVV